MAEEERKKQEEERRYKEREAAIKALTEKMISDLPNLAREAKSSAALRESLLRKRDKNFFNDLDVYNAALKQAKDFEKTDPDLAKILYELADKDSALDFALRSGDKDSVYDYTTERIVGAESSADDFGHFYSLGRSVVSGSMAGR